ncbi:hypothetical protein BDZ97DRAFT_1913295 [Flammula alnicola]|nr:hypothetical protein BDZ97DRAFT_1913295 [Flammula alnicola]
MSHSGRGKQSKRSALLDPIQDIYNRIRNRLPSPQPPQLVTGTELATKSFTRQTVTVQNGFIAPPKMSGDEVANTNTPLPVSQANCSTSVTPITKSPTSREPSENVNPQYNAYAAIGGLPTTVVIPEPGVQRAKAVGSVAYEGLKLVLQGLSDCSGMFPPLKTAAGGLLTIIKIADAVSANKEELEDLKAKLEAIISIIKKYQKYNGLRVLDHRIEDFCNAIADQVNAVEKLDDSSLLTRVAESTKDAGTILKAFRNISILCDVFQVDTQLNIEETVENIDDTVKSISQRLNSGSIDKLNHEMTSHKTRHSSYGDPVGCMPGTRVNILADLDAWASGDDSHKVYWMVGMAGTGKSTISHTLCEILDRKNMLGASFFGSRASEKTSNARLIVPVIAHALARASPSIKVEIVKAIEDDPALAEPTYSNLNEQFKKLIYNPIRTTAGKVAKTYKIIVIDAVDECVNLGVVSSLIKLILQSTFDIPLKFFIASRDEDLIRSAFYDLPKLSTTFKLHEVEKHLVEDDIRKYIERSLSDIKSPGLDPTPDAWPAPSELSKLLDHSGRLFIYAATTIRYIRDGRKLYKYRLSLMANPDSKTGSKLQTSTIDGLYGHILEQACASREDSEVIPMRRLISIIEHAPVAPFHASFPDFITDSTRCSPKSYPSFPALVSSEGHEMLALKCLEHMNRSLKYNICNIPEELTLSRREATNSLDNIGEISEALKYSCLYWASHLAEVQISGSDLVTVLFVFLHTHFLHWIECLSVLGELQTGLKSLESATAVLSRLQMTDIRCHELQLLVDDARRCLQMNFESIQKHCFEIYHSALAWIPNESLIRKVYATDVSRAPKLTLGLSNSWDPTEIVMQNSSGVNSVAFSQDGSRIISGSDDETVIWNATTGEVQAELKGHRVQDELQGLRAEVASVAFSRDGSQVVSGSYVKTVRIWNAMTGEVQAELKGHTARVTSVVFSLDGGRVVSGSYDKTVRIWNAMTSEVQAELKGHMDGVNSVAFSQDGSRVVSGSYDATVRIWNVTTGEVQAELKGHTGLVNSITFSYDGSRVVSGSYDKTVRIWNAMTGEVQAELKGHTARVTSVVFSLDGGRVVSGSYDKTVRIWNAMTSEVQAELKGHMDVVNSVAFSQDGSRVVSGSYDATVRIWNVTTGEVQAELKGHTSWVMSVAFSQDGSRVVSGSADDTVRIWNATTGEVQAELKGHTGLVRSVAFSQDGSRVVSGSYDETVRIWNVTTGEVHVMTTLSVKLPDSSEVHRAGTGKFFIVYPVQPMLSIDPTLSISDDGHWIVGALRDCWIPSHYCDFTSSSFSRDRACFGYSSGRVVILDVSVAL